jgi:hypothetical protein
MPLPLRNMTVWTLKLAKQLMKNVGFNVVRMGHLACFDNNSDATKTEIQKITTL